MNRTMLTALAAVGAVATAHAEPVPVEDCVRLALDRAPAVRVALAESASARSQIGVGRAAYFPTLSGHAEYGKAKGYDEAVTNGGSTQAVVRLETKLLDGGVRRAAVDAATARFGAAASAEQQSRADIAFAVRTAYYEALAARGDARRSAESSRTLRDYVSLLERQAAASAVPENDVLRAKLAVTAEETHARESASAFAVARGELASLIDRKLDEESLVDLPDRAGPADPANPPAPAAGEPTADDVDAAAPVVSARAALEAAEQEARGIRAEAWGDLALTADAGAIGVRPRDTFEHDGGAQFLLGVSVPLFDGGARASRLSAALAQVGAARARLDEARRNVALTLERLRAEEARARADLASARASLPLAEKNFQLLQARHLGGGNVRLLDVLDGLGQVSELRRSITKAELAERQAAAGRAQALGKVVP